MRAVKIVKESDACYKLVCQLTSEDLAQLPEQLNRQDLKKAEFTIENAISCAGYWFRPCYQREWGGREGEILIEPPEVEETKREGGKKK